MPKPIIGIPKGFSRPSVVHLGALARVGRRGVAGPAAPPEPVSESRVLPTVAAALWAAAALVAGYAAVGQLNDADSLTIAGRDTDHLYWLGGAQFAITAAGLWLGWGLLRAPTRRTLGYSAVLGIVAALGAVAMLVIPEVPRIGSVAGVFAVGAAVASLIARPGVPAPTK